MTIIELNLFKFFYERFIESVDKRHLSQFVIYCTRMRMEFNQYISMSKSSFIENTHVIVREKKQQDYYCKSNSNGGMKWVIKLL